MKTLKFITFYLNLIYLSLIVAFIIHFISSGGGFLNIFWKTSGLVLLLPIPLGLILSLHSLYTKKQMDTNWEKFLTYLPSINMILFALILLKSQLY